MSATAQISRRSNKYDRRRESPALWLGSLRVFSIRSAVKDDRHRPVVDEFNFHVGAELTGFNLNIAVAHQREKVLVEAARVVRWGGASEGGAPSRIGVGEQGELRHDKQLAADSRQRAIHLAIGIGEYANPEDSIGKLGGVGCGIVARDSEQNHKAAPYLTENSAVDANL